MHRLELDMRLTGGRISRICKGSWSVTPDTAIKLAHYFKNLPKENIPAGQRPGDPRFWLDLQQEYDFDVALRAKDWQEILADIRPWHVREKMGSLPLFSSEEGLLKS